MTQGPDSKFSNLLSPLALGTTVLRNRVVVTAHGTYNVDADTGAPDAREAAYWEARARGGAGLLVTGTNLVHPSSPFNLGQYKNYGEAATPGLAAVADAAHRYGAVIVTQMGHMGQRAYGFQETWGPSPISWQGRPYGIVPHEMTQVEITEVIDAYAAASERSVAAGMDGIELAVGHGQLINAFLSPVTNQRTDSYGGDPTKRLRFCLQIVDEIRARIGIEPLLGFRINAHDLTPGGLDDSDWLEIAQALQSTGAGSYISVSADFTGSLIPTVYHAQGLWLDWTAPIRKAVSLPVIGVGRIVDPEVAESALASGAVDLVGMTRAHICDPELVTKLATNRRADIRPCIGCLQMCVGQLWRRGNVRCVYNPATGLELTRHHGGPRAARTRRRVTIIGAGPAGLEAARVAAGSGHEVTILERRAAPGGAFARYATLAGRADFGRATAWLAEQAVAAGADLRLSVEASPAEISELCPDRVIVATGARPSLPPWAIPGLVLALEDGIDTMTADGGLHALQITVIDDDYGRGLTVALELAARGNALTVLTHHETVAPGMELNMREDMEARLRDRSAQIMCATTVDGALPRDDGVALILSNPGGSARTYAGRVLVADAVADASLAEAVRAAMPEVVLSLIGDAVRPGRLEHAVEDGYTAALAVDREQTMGSQATSRTKGRISV